MRIPRSVPGKTWYAVLALAALAALGVSTVVGAGLSLWHGSAAQRAVGVPDDRALLPGSGVVTVPGRQAKPRHPASVGPPAAPAHPGAVTGPAPSVPAGTGHRRSPATQHPQRPRPAGPRHVPHPAPPPAATKPLVELRTPVQLPALRIVVRLGTRVVLIGSGPHPIVVRLPVTVDGDGHGRGPHPGHHDGHEWGDHRDARPGQGRARHGDHARGHGDHARGHGGGHGRAVGHAHGHGHGHGHGYGYGHDD